MGLLDILQQYAGNALAPQQGSVHQHFDEVAPQVSQQDLGSGIASAFRSMALKSTKGPIRKML